MKLDGMLERLPLWEAAAQGKTVRCFCFVRSDWYDIGKDDDFSLGVFDFPFYWQGKSILIRFMAEEKSTDGICRMAAGGFVFFPADEGTKEYIKIGLKAAFLRAGGFRRLKEEYGDFI